MKRSLISAVMITVLALTSAVLTSVKTPADESAAQPDSPDRAVNSAYLAELQSRRDTILDYNWQMSDGEFHYPAGSEPDAMKPIALADIQGDDAPELIYISAPNQYTADLFITGWKDGASKELCSFPQWDVCAASGTSYALFKVKGEKTLYAYSYIGDEIGFFSWYRFSEQDGALQADKIASADIHYANDDQKPDSFTIDGQPADRAAYDDFTMGLIGKAETTVLYSARPEFDTYFDALFDLPMAGMSYDEAVLALYGQSGSISGSDSGSALLSSLNGLQLSFMSGAGAWSSELMMQEDGLFVLNYHDSDMGSSGEGYDATIYVCEASGRFDQVRKINDTTYTMHLAELAVENQPGTEWISEEYGARVRYVASDPYGLDNTETVTVYLPGTPLDAIPDDALFKTFYEGTILNGVVIMGSGDFFTSQLPASGISPAAVTPAGSSSPATDDSEEKQIFSDSSDRILSESDIAGLSSDQIQTAVNEVYARHGYAFKTPEVREHFEQFSWYRAENTDMDAVAGQFNSTETANVRLLASHL